MRAILIAGLMLAVVPLAGVAQTAWVGPQPPCDIKPGHFRLNSVPVNFKTAYDKPTQRDRMLSQTLDVLTRSLTQDGQDQNPAAWYYLGRYYVEMGDAVGADSAFDRAAALAPECEQDIDRYRHALWADVYSAAQRNEQQGQVDSAAALFRAAGALLPADPRPWFAMGAMYARRDQVDSATAYLRLAAERAAGDTAYTDARRDALAQTARLHFRPVQSAPEIEAFARTRFSRDSLERQIYVDSIVLSRLEASAASRRARGARLAPADQRVFASDSAARAHALATGREARTALAARAAAESTAVQPVTGPAILASLELVRNFPDEGEGVTALALLYAQSGRVADATAAFDAIYPPDTPLDGELVSDAGRRMIRVGLAAQGAAVLARGLEKAPYDRDGWNDLATAYRMVRDGSGMLTASRRLVALDPLNRGAVRQLATAWELAGQADSAARYQALVDTGIPVEIAVSSFVPGAGGRILTGIAANALSTPSRPLRITFEFLDTAGQPLVSQAVEIPALPAQGSHQFEVRVADPAARGWRYRLN